MARVVPEALANRELAKVFVAMTLREALRAEELLTLRGVSYVVQAERFGRTLFGSPRSGAVFYVPEGQAAYCASELNAAGLGLGVLFEEEGQS
jgi:hypothetical protein